ncbi:MAG TPA: hypothetical protein VIL46_16620, partial [Gemmataceae bacterium]
MVRRMLIVGLLLSATLSMGCHRRYFCRWHRWCAPACDVCCTPCVDVGCDACFKPALAPPVPLHEVPAPPAPGPSVPLPPAGVQETVAPPTAAPLS